MVERVDPRENAVGTVLRVLLVLDAVTYLVAASLHQGLQIPLGFATLSEPYILPATIVEGLSGLFLAIGALAAFARTAWAWWTVLSAHVFSILGVLVGMYALSVGAGPSTDLNHSYHQVILLMLVVGLALLLTPAGRGALRPPTRD